MKFVQTALFAGILLLGAKRDGLAQSGTWNGGSGTWNGTPTNWTCSYGPCGPPNGSGWTANIGAGNVSSGTAVNSGVVAVGSGGSLSISGSGLSVNQMTVGTAGGPGTLVLMGSMLGSDGSLSSQLEIAQSGSMTATNSSIVMSAVGIGTGGLTLKSSSLSAGFLNVGSGGSLTVGTGSTVTAVNGFSLQGGILSFAIGNGSGYGTLSSNHGTFGGTIDFDFINGFAPMAGESFQLISALGGGDFSGASYEVQGLAAGFQYSILDEPYGLDLVAVNEGVSAAPEPEPVGLMVVAIGLGCVWAVTKRYGCFRRSSLGRGE